MFLIDENISTKEIRKEINEILKPIKLFCKKTGVQVQYESKVIVTSEITKRINELMELFKQYKGENIQMKIKQLQQYELDLDLFSRSVNNLDEIEIALIYHELFADKTQTELAEDGDIREMLNVENLSQTTINRLLKNAYLNLLELMRYNQMKHSVYKVDDAQTNKAYYL